MEILTNQIVNKVFDESETANIFKRRKESSFLYTYNINIGFDYVKSMREKFYYNFGKVCDGSSIRINSNTKYLKIETNLNINREREKASLQNTYERSKSELPSAFVFINGLKIPDRLIYTYCNGSNTDIFVPDYFLNGEIALSDVNNIFVEVRNFKKFQYINHYQKNFVGNTISFQLDNDEYISLNGSISENCVSIYINKKFIKTRKNIVLGSSKTLTIEMTDINITSNSEIEIFIDKNIKYSNTYINNILEQQNYISFNISESYIDSIHGSINKNNCLFFIDGKRVSNETIIQVGRLNYVKQISQGTTFDSNLVQATVIVTDMEYIDEEKSEYLGNDYFIYNVLGVNKVTRKLVGFNTNTIFDSINFPKYLNNFGEKYNYTTFKNFLDDYKNGGYSLKIKFDKIVEKNKFDIIKFLSHFRKKEIKFNVFVPSNSIDVKLEIELSKYFNKIMDDVVFEVSTKTKHVPDSKITYSMKNNILKIKIIDVNYFEKNKNNDVYITIYNNAPNTPKYFVIQPNEFVLENGIYKKEVIFSSDFEPEENEFCVLKRDDNNPDKWYPYGITQGYSVNEKINILTTSNSVILVSNTPITEINYLLYRKFVNKVVKKIDRDFEKLEDLYIPIVLNSENLPLIRSGNIDVFLNDTKIYEGVDFFIKDPLDENSNVATTVFVIKRFIKQGDELNIYFTGVKNKIFYLSEKHHMNNKYGLLYIGNLEFPFHQDYMEVSVNGKILRKEDIDVISSKLIRIPKEYVPFRDIFISSKFKYDYDVLKVLFSNYDFDDIDDLLNYNFRNVDYTKPKDMNTYPNPSSIYETFIETVDSVNRVPNPVWDNTFDDYDVIRFNIYKYAFCLWMKNGGYKVIIDNKFVPYEILKQFEIFKAPEESYDIIFNGVDDILSDIHFGIEDCPYSIKSGLDHFAEFINGLDSPKTPKEAWELYVADKKYPNILYPHEMIPIILGHPIDNENNRFLVGGN